MPELDLLQQRVSQSFLRVQNHLIIINGIVIDAEYLTVMWEHEYSKTELESSNRTIILMGYTDMVRWLKGRRSLNDIFLSLKFDMTREPNIENTLVFDFLMRIL